MRESGGEDEVGCRILMFNQVYWGISPTGPFALLEPHDHEIGESFVVQNVLYVKGSVGRA